jgi:hypothetical protein
VRDERKAGARILLASGFAVLLAGTLTYFVWFFVDLAGPSSYPSGRLVAYGVELGVIPIGYLLAGVAWWLLASYAATSTTHGVVVRRGFVWLLLPSFAALGAVGAQLSFALRSRSSESPWFLAALSLQTLGGVLLVGGFLWTSAVFVAVGRGHAADVAASEVRLEAFGADAALP